MRLQQSRMRGRITHSGVLPMRVSETSLLQRGASWAGSPGRPGSPGLAVDLLLPGFSCKLWHPNARGVPAPPRPLPLRRATQPPLPLSPLPTPTPRPAGDPAVQSPGLWTNPTCSARDTAVLLSSPLREPDSLTPILTSRAGQTPPLPGAWVVAEMAQGLLRPCQGQRARLAQR